MARLRPTNREPQQPDPGLNGDDALALRWLVILAIAGAIGFGVYQAEGIGAGATVTIGVIALLHTIVATTKESRR